MRFAPSFPLSLLLARCAATDGRDDAATFDSQAPGLGLEAPGKKLSGRFELDGAWLEGGGHVVGIRTFSFGRGEADLAVERDAPALGSCAANLVSAGDRCVRRVEYASGTVTEWWESHAAGLEQGWIVDEAPPGEGDLVVAVSVAGAAVDVEAGKLWLKGDAGTLLVGSGLAAWDAEGRVLDTWFVATVSGFEVRVDDALAVYPVEIDPVYSTAATTLTGPADIISFGKGTPTPADVNGDGYPDVLVRGRDPTAGSEGADVVFAHHGSPTGLAASAATTLTEGTPWTFFGANGLAVADVNGDGYDDVIVTGSGYGPRVGRAWVYHGSSAGLSATAALTLDGKSDGDCFGWAAPAVADVNADGYDDLIIAAVNYVDDTGRAYVFHGSAGGWTRRSRQVSTARPRTTTSARPPPRSET